MADADLNVALFECASADVKKFNFTPDSITFQETDIIRDGAYVLLCCCALLAAVLVAALFVAFELCLLLSHRWLCAVMNHPSIHPIDWGC